MNVIILSAIWGVLMMYVGFIGKSKNLPTYIAIAGMIFLLVVNWMEYLGIGLFDINTKGMLMYDSFSLIFNQVMLISILVYFLLSGSQVSSFKNNVSDLYALIFFIITGISVVAGFKSLLMLFIGIEIISIPLYVLAGSEKSNLKSNEAALKYFLMGAFSTGLMLMGIAFLYGNAGTFMVEEIQLGATEITPMLSIGLILLLSSMSFKVSAAPFHFWTPDVYDGAPTVFTSFMATVVKSAAFFAFFKLFQNAFGNIKDEWGILVAVIAVFTLVIGNITAVFQQSLKRMLSYSSIAQAGFMLLGVFAMNSFAKQGLILYFAAYSLATIGIFAVLAKFKDHSIEAFNGFAKQHPVVAFGMLICILSLAGIPLTAGFFAKYFMLLGVIEQGNMIWLAIIAVVCAAVSVYYYFRVLQAIYFKEAATQIDITFSKPFGYLMLVNAALIIALGIHPDWLLSYLNM
jgi:NADH-quinone oxidoreductase subunit N